MRHRRPSLLRSVTLLWILTVQSAGWSALAVADTAALDPATSSDVPMPTYKPRESNMPRARIGGKTRGSDSEAPFLIALVPDHIAFTIKQDPALCWYLSRHTSRPLTITVVDSRGIRPILERPLPDSRHAGIHCIRLREHGLVLKEQEQYRWFVTLVLDPDKPSQDVVAGGMIERIPFDEACMLNMPCSWTSCEREAVYRYAESGLWYDAIACLVDLIERNGDGNTLRKMLDHLLRQSGVDLPS
jgi:hypothetical protein